jgi:hypothetical protein
MPISEFFSSGNFAFFPQKSFEGVILDFLLSHGKHLPKKTAGPKRCASLTAILKKHVCCSIDQDLVLSFLFCFLKFPTQLESRMVSQMHGFLKLINQI